MDSNSDKEPESYNKAIDHLTSKVNYKTKTKFKINNKNQCISNNNHKSNHNKDSVCIQIKNLDKAIFIIYLIIK